MVFLIFFGTGGSSIVLFGSYIEWLREKRQLEGFLMDFGKDAEETRNKQFEREWEEQSINRMIRNRKKTGQEYDLSKVVKL